MNSTERQGLYARAEAVGFPFAHHSGSEHVAGPEKWRRIDTLPLAAIREIVPQLEAHEDQARRDAERTTRDEHRDADAARRRVPLTDTDPEFAEVRGMAAAAAAAHATSEMPITRGQGDALLAVMRDVLAELQRRG